LVAVWKTVGAQRFQNYRATFTIVDAPGIPRAWIDAIFAGKPLSPDAPEAWRVWRESGRYRPLTRP
jgi:hypothetical protein